MIEAIRKPGPTFMAAVQWHPEFHRAGEGTLDDRPLLDDFLAAARAARHTMSPSFSITNPATGEPIAELPADDAASVAAKAARARAAQPAWAARPLAERKAADRGLSRRASSPSSRRSAATLTAEVGKPWRSRATN